MVLQHLIDIHKSRGDKILIFIDYVDILVEYARRLGYPYISGDLKNYEREKIIQFFKHLGGDWNVLFLSRVGDVGIDLPDANVAIEVSSLFGSRRQEAQRLGRILRPKEKKQGETYQSYFYTLVSLATSEVKYSFKRQKFLIEQGYNFKILNEEELPYNKDPSYKKRFKMSTEESQRKFLEELLITSSQREKDKPDSSSMNNNSKTVFKMRERNDGNVFIDR